MWFSLKKQLKIHSLAIKSNCRIVPVLYIHFSRSAKGPGCNARKGPSLSLLSLYDKTPHRLFTPTPSPAVSTRSSSFHYSAIDLAAHSLKTFLEEEEGGRSRVDNFRLFCSGPRNRGNTWTQLRNSCPVFWAQGKTTLLPSRKLSIYTQGTRYTQKNKSEVQLQGSRGLPLKLAL